MSVRQCSKCLETKTLEEFVRPPRRDLKCKSCLSEQAKRWRQRHPSAARIIEKRWYLLRAYGLTEQAYQDLMEKQQGLCAICKTTLISRPNVDHCHQTGRVRGILCCTCNMGLGSFGDSILRLTWAIEYLKGESVVF